MFLHHRTGQTLGPYGMLLSGDLKKGRMRHWSTCDLFERAQKQTVHETQGSDSIRQVMHPTEHIERKG